MDRFYYELTIVPDSYYELFLDLIIDLTTEAIEESNGSIIIRSEDEPKDIENGIKAFVLELSKAFQTDIKCDIKLEKKENINWIEKYQQSVQPIEVGEFYIHPSWTTPSEDKINILIDPALTFGSGHHETTSSCLKAISKYIKKDDLVLDVGCGSGILGIASAKKGAIVDICDTDIAAVEDTIKNFTTNDVSIHQSWEGSVEKAPTTYDVVIANIVADVLVMINKNLKKATKDDGLLILSGIMQQHKQKVLNKFQECEVIETIKTNQWITLILKNKLTK